MREKGSYACRVLTLLAGRDQSTEGTYYVVYKGVPLAGLSHSTIHSHIMPSVPPHTTKEFILFLVPTCTVCEASEVVSESVVIPW